MAGVTRWDPFQELLLIEDDEPAPQRPATDQPDAHGQHQDPPAPLPAEQSPPHPHATDRGGSGQ